MVGRFRFEESRCVILSSIFLIWAIPAAFRAALLGALGMEIVVAIRAVAGCGVVQSMPGEPEAEHRDESSDGRDENS